MATTHLNRLKQARDELALVYKEKATDADYDNETLNQIHNAVATIEDVINLLSTREKK